jgi:hypothetical protein
MNNQEDIKTTVENNNAYNKSMERRRKQRRCYQRCSLNFGLRVAGFRLAHLNRSTAFFDSATVQN